MIIPRGSIVSSTPAALLKAGSIVLFGETHGFATQEHAALRDIVTLVQPQLLLYERLEDRYLAATELQQVIASPLAPFSIVTDMGDLIPVLRIASTYSIPVHGIDLRNLGRTQAIPASFEMTDELNALEEDLNTRREEEQTKHIRSALASNQRFVAITGAYHLRKESPLLADIHNVFVVIPTCDGTYDFDDTVDPQTIHFELWTVEEWRSPPKAL